MDDVPAVGFMVSYAPNACVVGAAVQPFADHAPEFADHAPEFVEQPAELATPEHPQEPSPEPFPIADPAPEPAPSPGPPARW